MMTKAPDWRDALTPDEANCLLLIDEQIGVWLKQVDHLRATRRRYQNRAARRLARAKAKQIETEL